MKSTVSGLPNAEKIRTLKKNLPLISQFCIVSKIRPSTGQEEESMEEVNKKREGATIPDDDKRLKRPKKDDIASPSSSLDPSTTPSTSSVGSEKQEKISPFAAAMKGFSLCSHIPCVLSLNTKQMHKIEPHPSRELL
jgi:hypothetical protein